jgi:hypothetical protein
MRRLLVFVLSLIVVSLSLAQESRHAKKVLYTLKEGEVLRHNEMNLLFNNGVNAVLLIDFTTNGRVDSTKVIIGDSMYMAREGFWPSLSGLYNFYADQDRFTLDIFRNTIVKVPNGFIESVYGSNWYPLSRAVRLAKQKGDGYENFVSYPDGSIYGPYEEVKIVTQKDNSVPRRYSSHRLRTYDVKDAGTIDTIPGTKKIFKQFRYRTKEGYFFFNNGEIYGPVENEFNITFQDTNWLIRETFYERTGNFSEWFYNYYTSFGDSLLRTKSSICLHKDGKWSWFEKATDTKYIYQNPEKRYAAGDPPMYYYYLSDGNKFGPLFHPGIVYRDGNVRVQHWPCKLYPSKNKDTVAVKVIYKNKGFDIVEGRKRRPVLVKGRYEERGGIELVIGNYIPNVYVNQKKVGSRYYGRAGFIGNSTDWYTTWKTKKGGYMVKLSNGREFRMSHEFSAGWITGHNASVYVNQYHDSTFTKTYLYLSVLDSVIEFNEYNRNRSLLSKNGRHFAIFNSKTLRASIDGKEFNEGFGLCYRKEEDAFFWVSVEGNNIILNQYNCSDE